MGKGVEKAEEMGLVEKEVKVEGEAGQVVEEERAREGRETKAVRGKGQEGREAVQRSSRVASQTRQGHLCAMLGH